MLQEKYQVSQRRACNVLEQPRSTQRFEGRPRDEDARLTKRILELVRERPRWDQFIEELTLKQIIFDCHGARQSSFDSRPALDSLLGLPKTEDPPLFDYECLECLGPHLTLQGLVSLWD